MLTDLCALDLVGAMMDSAPHELAGFLLGKQAIALDEEMIQAVGGCCVGGASRAVAE